MIVMAHCPLLEPLVNVIVFVPAVENDLVTDEPEPDEPAGLIPVAGETAHVYVLAPLPVKV